MAHKKKNPHARPPLSGPIRQIHNEAAEGGNAARTGKSPPSPHNIAARTRDRAAGWRAPHEADRLRVVGVSGKNHIPPSLAMLSFGLEVPREDRSTVNETEMSSPPPRRFRPRTHIIGLSHGQVSAMTYQWDTKTHQCSLNTPTAGTTR